MRSYASRMCHVTDIYSMFVLPYVVVNNICSFLPHVVCFRISELSADSILAPLLDVPTVRAQPFVNDSEAISGAYTNVKDESIILEAPTLTL